MKYTHGPSSRSSSGIANTHTHIHPFLLLNISMYTLAAICFMIYTTELNYAHAEGEEDLGSASASLDASVTVGTACNFSGNVDIPHTSTIMNGVNSTDIGKTTMNVTCNDQGGYAVYAVGYTNDEYGNNTLQSCVSDDYNIFTGTSTSGNTSNWSMKLSTVPGTTTATIENGYNNYNTVPDDYTKVASLSTITDPSTPNTGSSIATTYQTYISPTQPAGTYTGKVKYTLVHPSSAAKPIAPDISKLTYMQDFARLSNDNKSSVFRSAKEGVTYTLRDERDGQYYTAAKLKDGNIWMTKNLNLAGGTEITSEFSDVPEGYTLPTENGFQSGNRLPLSATQLDDGRDKAFVYNSGRDSDEYCPDSGCYSYYSWTAATAGSGLDITTDNTDAPYSICPKGWKLPSTKTQSAANWQSNSDFYKLATAYGMSASSSSQITSEFYSQAGSGTTPNFLSAFYYMPNLGRFNFREGYGGNYWSSTGDEDNAALFLYFTPGYVNTAGRYGWGDGLAVRCLVK